MNKFKNKYEAFNYLNEKYDVCFYEITCYEEAREFWGDFRLLWQMGKITENDMNLGEMAMDNFTNFIVKLEVIK